MEKSICINDGGLPQCLDTNQPYCHAPIGYNGHHHWLHAGTVSCYGRSPSAAPDLRYGAIIGTYHAGRDLLRRHFWRLNFCYFDSHPGTPASAATAIDGYAMTLKGKAGKALGTACTASFLAACCPVFPSISLLPILAELAMKFGSPEYFWLSLFGLYHHCRHQLRLHDLGAYERSLWPCSFHHRHGPYGRSGTVHVRPGCPL